MAQNDIVLTVALDDKGLKKGLRDIATSTNQLTKQIDKLVAAQKKFNTHQKQVAKSEEKQKSNKQKLIQLAKEQQQKMQTQLDIERQRTKQLQIRFKLKEDQKVKRLIDLAKEQAIQHQTNLDLEKQRRREAERKAKIKEDERLRKVKKAEKDLVQVRALARRQLRKMNEAVKAANTNYAKLGISFRTLRKASLGSSKAISQVSRALSVANVQMVKAKKGLFSITNGGRLLSNSFATLRSKLLLVSFGIGLVTSSLVRMVKMFAEQENSVIKMARVFGTDAADSLDKYSSSLQEVTTFGDEVINSVMATIGSFGANEDQTKALTKASLDLASGLEMDVNSAALLIAKTFGSSTNALSRYGIEVDSAMSQQEKLTAITEGVSDKFGGLAEVMALTTSGQLKQASNAFGDLQERLGEALAPLVLAFARGLKAFSEAIPLKAIRLFIVGLASLTTGIITFRLWTLATTKVIKMITAAKVIWRTTTWSLTGAIAAFNMVSAKSKWGAALSIGTSIGVAWGAWANNTEELTNEQQKLLDKLNEIAKSRNLDIEKDAERIQSIHDTIEALKKEQNILTAKMTKQGFALKVKLKEIELGRKLDATEKAQLHTLHQLQKGYEIYTENIQKNEDARKSLVGTFESSKDGQIKALEEEIAFAEKLKDLTPDELKGLEQKRIQLQALIDVKNIMNEALSEDIEFQKEQIQQKIDLLLWLEQEIGKTEQLTKAINNLKKAKEEVGETEGKTHEFSMFANEEQRNATIRLIKGLGSLAKAHKEGALVAGRLSQLAAVINTWEAVTEALPNKLKAAAALVSGLAAIANIEAALGSMSSTSSSVGVPKAAEGGYIGGKPHSQGGTLIEAERGEFIMSRNAVESIGLETLNTMNSTGSNNAINITVTGNVMTQDFVEGELAESIKEAVRKGSDFGIG